MRDGRYRYRRPRHAVQLALAALVAACALHGCATATPAGFDPNTPSADPQEAAPATPPAADPTPAAATAAAAAAATTAPTAPQGRGLVEVAVLRVVDGDTIHVRMPDGRRERIRFIGVDTPESTIEHEPYGKEASAYTTRALAGRRVFLQRDAELRDRYGRMLAYVWLARPSTGSAAEVRAMMFNARLLLDGYASMMTIPPNVAYADVFRPMQAEARDAGRGLWGLPASP